MEKNKEIQQDINTIVSNIEKVKKMKAAKHKEPSKSIRPLKFETNPDDSPLKEEIIKRINKKNLTYSDLYNFCTDLKGGDNAEGQNFGYNIIYGLKNRHTMIDTTFALLCDFLGLEICLVEKKEDTDDTNENFGPDDK